MDNVRNHTELKISTKFPIVLIEKLESLCKKIKLHKTTSSKVKDVASKYYSCREMKNENLNVIEGIISNGEYVNYSNDCVQSKELVHRKRIFTDTPEEHIENSQHSDRFHSNYCCRETLSPFGNSEKQNLINVIYTKISPLSHSQCVSHKHIKAGTTNNCNGSLQNQHLESMSSDQTTDKKIKVDKTSRKIKPNLRNGEEKQFTCKNINRNELETCSLFANLPSSSTRYLPKKILNAYNSCLGKPIAHIEPFVLDSNTRSHQIKGKVLHDSVAVEVNCNNDNREGRTGIKEINSKQYNNNFLKKFPSLILKSEDEHSRKKSDYPDTSWTPNGEVKHYRTVSRTEKHCNQPISSDSSNTSIPAEITDLRKRYSHAFHDKFSNSLKQMGRNRIYSNSISETNYSGNISNTVPAHKIHKEISSTWIQKLKDNLKNEENTSKLGRGRSLSIDDVDILNNNMVTKIKPSISLPDLSSTNTLEFSSLNFEEANSSSTSTDAVDLSEESCSDEGVRPLHVDELNTLNLRKNSYTEILNPEILTKDYFKKYKRKMKRRAKALSKLTGENHKPINRTYFRNKCHKRTYKERTTKKSKKANGPAVNQIRLQQQFLSEQDRDRRLAQELPGFNWLEEKIRKKSDSSNSEYINSSESAHDLKKIQLSANLDERRSNDLTTANKQIPDLVPGVITADLQQNPLTSPHFTSFDYLPTLNVSTGSKTEMTLNTVSSSTPRHSPTAEDVEKQTDGHLQPPAHESKQVEKKEPPDKPTNYLKRHIQTAVPPLIPTYKVTALPKQRIASKELKSPTKETQDKMVYEGGDICQTAPSATLSDAKDTIFSRKDEDRAADSGQFSTEKRNSNTLQNEKLSILKEAFKSKLNGCSELKSMDSEGQCNESNGGRKMVGKHSISENKSKSMVEDDQACLNTEQAEGSVSPPSIQDEDNLLESCSNSVADSLLGKILMQDNKPILNSPLVIATLLEELMKTRKEVEKLRKVQEQMLKGEKFYGTEIESKPQKGDINIKKSLTLSSEDKRPAINQFEDRNERPLNEEEDDKNSRKRESPIEQTFMNKKQKTIFQQSCNDPNTIMIRYTLPPSEYNSESVQSSGPGKHRNLVGMYKSDSEVLPIDNRSPVQRLDVDCNSRNVIMPASNAAMKSNQEKNVHQEPYKNELMKLLDPSSKYQRAPIPELPNLIPSSNCSPSAFQKNLPYYGDKVPVNLARYHYPQPSAAPPPKQCSQTLERYNYNPRFFYESRNDGVVEAEMQVSPNKIPLSKHSEKHYSATNPRISPQQEVVVNRNERFSNLNYPSHYNEKISYETAKIHKAKLSGPPPQTFQPKILIPPEGNNSHYKEWHHTVHHPGTTGDHPHYQRFPSQVPIHIKSLATPIVSSTYQYKSAANTKATDVYAHHKQYSPKLTQCDSSTVKQSREKSQSPIEMKPARTQNCVNSFISPPGMAHSSSNSYYSPHLRTMHSNPPTIVNHPQYSQVMVSNRNPVSSKQVFYDQRPVIQSLQEQKVATTYTHPAHSPPFPLTDGPQPHRYIVPRPTPYDNRPASLDDHDKKPMHQLNRIIPDISQTRIVNVNQSKQFQEQVSSSPARNCSPNSKILSKKCHLCERLAQFVCSGCKMAWYCSKECQREHWSQHSPTCTTKR